AVFDVNGSTVSTTTAESTGSHANAQWTVFVPGSGTFTLQSASSPVVLWTGNGSEHATIECDDGTTEPPTIFNLCKVVEDNGDAVDNSGTFSFDVRWIMAVGEQVHLAATEGGGPSCQTIEVPGDATNVEVVEWADT